MNFKYVAAALLGGFIIMMSTLVYKAVSTDFYLVTDKYYEEGVHHDEMQHRLDNVASLSEKVTARVIEDKLMIQIPSAVDSGKIVLYRPSNGNKDVVLILGKNQSVIDYDANKLDKGKWIAKINWSLGKEEYYSEKDVFIKE